MKRLAFVFSIILIAFASCNRTDNYIIPVDYEKHYAGITSLTEKEGQELSQKIYMDWYNNTMGKEIPDIQVKDLDGNTIKLKKWLNRETILVFTDTHCGFGAEEVEKELPMTISNMKDELADIDIMCLIEDAEISAPGEALDYAKSLKDIYNNIFIIDQQDALRMNLTGSPSKFYIDKDQIVRQVHIGFAMNQEQREESIRQGISLMKKEKQK
ncbi:MAG: redoxin family protein [Bacteroidales bacterium]|nr:redoxin family protein [Bacteroidales bacterium]